MSFTWGEVSKWSKSHGYKISRKEEKFYSTNINTSEVQECCSLEELVKFVFNQMSKNQWVEHQKNYEKQKK
jgi:hypothetical protein